ncbi:MAG TPA: hypothetical protein DCZ91_15410 [Lachnospiraceae bacterium]|nr:hypothetical protein [Lachnospiraceae bacterium]
MSKQELRAVKAYRLTTDGIYDSDGTFEKHRIQEVPDIGIGCKNGRKYDLETGRAGDGRRKEC